MSGNGQDEDDDDWRQALDMMNDCDDEELAAPNSADDDWAQALQHLEDAQPDEEDDLDPSMLQLALLIAHADVPGPFAPAANLIITGACIHHIALVASSDPRDPLNEQANFPRRCV